MRFRLDLTQRQRFLERFRVYFQHARTSFGELGLTEQRLKKAKPDVTVLHPGPMNRGVEIESKVADGPHSVILTQVTFGIAVRMAVMDILNNCDR